MHLLLVCNEFPPAPHGGIGTFVLGMANQLVRYGIDVTVIGYDPTVASTVWQKEDHLQVLRLRKPLWNSVNIRLGRYSLGPALIMDRVYLSRQVDLAVRSGKIDLVESYDWGGPLWSPPPVSLVIRIHGANTVYAFYQKEQPSRLLRFFEKRNVKMGTHLVAVSRHIGDMTIQAFGIHNTRYSVIHNWVDSGRFTPNQAVERTENMVLYAGSIHPRKGIAELFKAMVLVFERQPAVQLVLAGRLPEDGGAFKKTLLSMIPDEFHSHVNFLGYVPYEKMAGYYQRAALAIFPSLAEAFGLTCVEAMACGAPVVMTSRASGPELVEHGVSGLLADPTDAKGLAEAICRLLENSVLRATISRNAVIHVQERFNPDVILDKNIQLYQSLV